jgi:starch synthase
MVGILNGIDTDTYHPSTDKYIPQNFTADTLGKRRINKIILQEEVGLEVNDSVLLIGMVSRLVEQKGVELVLQILDWFMGYTDFQLVILGRGDHDYETQLGQLSSRFSGRMSLQLLYNEGISQRVYAGSDAFLMPSRFEPGGISQMLAMHYGGVPIVRRTGGLVDTVSQHEPNEETGTGYCFDRYEPLDLYTAIVRAGEGFKYKDQWQQLQKRGMNQDFSWKKSALDYLKLYKDLLGLPEEVTEAEQNPLARLAG